MCVSKVDTVSLTANIQCEAGDIVVFSKDPCCQFPVGLNDMVLISNS